MRRPVEHVSQAGSSVERQNRVEAEARRRDGAYMELCGSVISLINCFICRWTRYAPVRGA